MRRAGLAIVLGLAAAGQGAHAEQPRTTPAAIEVDRDTTPAGRVGFGFDGGESVDAWGVSLALGWLERPIELGAGAFAAGSPQTQPVRRRETVTLGGALALGDSVVLDAAIRGSHQVGDRLRADGEPAGLARAVFHDVRFGARIRVAGNRDRAALLRADLTLPSGNGSQFAGDARWTAAWRLIGRLTVSRAIVVAGNVGIRLHGAEVQVGDHLVGDELFAAAGVAVPIAALGLDAPVALTGELAGALGDHVGKLAAPSPIEARLGAIIQALPALAIGVHVGAGLVDEIGAPRLRAVLELAWTPRVERAATAAPPPDEPDDDTDPP
ncbi:MAG: hypothetical protein ABIY55_12765 [Kofleriaceae bacterium]